MATRDKKGQCRLARSPVLVDKPWRVVLAVAIQKMLDEGADPIDDGGAT
jgi:hypothetical protein